VGYTKYLTRALFFAIFIFLVIALSDFFIPGKVKDTTFSTLGIIAIFATFFVDYLFNFAPSPDHKTEPKSEVEE